MNKKLNHTQPKPLKADLSVTCRRLAERISKWRKRKNSLIPRELKPPAPSSSALDKEAGRRMDEQTDRDRDTCICESLISDFIKLAVT